MNDLRCVRFDDLASVLEALEPYDDAFMNLCTGALHEQKSASTRAASETTNFLCLYSGEDLLLLLAHNSRNSTLVCPLEVEYLMTPEVVNTAGYTLASALFAINTCVRVTTVASKNDFEEFFPQWLAFADCTAGRLSLEVEENYLRQAITSGLAWTCWTCRTGGELVGFVVNGRATPRTVAIKNVYVPPEHRRKGYAEAMVRAMSRHYLGYFQSDTASPQIRPLLV
ncbi:hypothetical protein C8Q79DRAFT_1009481 [Trametes meyenii]|nr:hypothetical protein C8Q79DRAFT_1009481 [Trametes meyenii]